MIAEVHDMILIETVPNEKCCDCYFYDESCDCSVMRPSTECRDEYGRRCIWKQLSIETRRRYAPYFFTGDIMSESFSSAIDKMAKYIVLHYDGAIDHACEKCCPSDIVIDGYECAYHLAKRLEEAQQVIQPDNAR